MQASYSFTGENGLDAVAQLEARIRHDAQQAGPAATQLLESTAKYARQAIEAATVPITLDIDIVVRARTTSLSAPAHLAPPTAVEVAEVEAHDDVETDPPIEQDPLAPSDTTTNTDPELPPAPPVEGNPAPPSDAEGSETGTTGVAGVDP